MSDLNAFVNPVVRGVINPNKRITYKKELHFDSRFRDNYGAPNTSAASFLYTMPGEIDDVVSMRLASISVPDSFSTVSKDIGNNNFYIEDTLVVIPDGIYTLEALLYVIQSTVEATPSLSGITITFSQNPNYPEKTEIESDKDIVIRFYKPENCTNFMNTLGWLLGFRVAAVSLKVVPPATASIVSSGLFDDGSTNYLYFAVDDFQRNTSNNNVVYFNKTTSNNNILGKIYRSPVSQTYYLNNINTSTGNDADRARIYFGPVRLSKFKFSLLDKFGNLVDLNNMDYSFTLEVEVLYDRNNVTIPC